MTVEIYGNILNKLRTLSTVNLVRIQNSKIFSLYVWTNNPDTTIELRIDKQKISYTPNKIYDQGISAYDAGMIVKGLPMLLVYDDTNNIYLTVFRLDERLRIFEADIIPPVNQTIDYAYQVMVVKE